VIRPGAGPPAPGLAARQNVLAVRAGALDATGARYALFNLAFGSQADQDTLERALGAADRYQAELRHAAAAPQADRPRAGLDRDGRPEATQ
jgi:hypothetical protein